MLSKDTLYERLGGQDAIDAVVEEFYNRVLADEDLKPYFEGIDTDDLRAHQKDFLTYATGDAMTMQGRVCTTPTLTWKSRTRHSTVLPTI